MDFGNQQHQHISMTNTSSFTKQQPAQKESKTMIDRFRALVKEKEEEYRVFGGELGTDEIVTIYDLLLSSLTFNSKPVITDLTIIAGDMRAHGHGIADAICARIVQAPVDQKLPSLYLLDSIVKNIGKEYIRHFSARLPEVFCDAYLQVDRNMQPALRHLFGTWATVFPSSVLHRIEVELRFSPTVHGQAQASPRPSHGIHINPKYLDSKHQFRHSSVDAVEDALKKPMSSAAMAPKYAPSHVTARAGSLSSSIDEYTVDNSPKRLAIRASPSHVAHDYGLGRMIDREEETSELLPRNWHGNSNRHLKTNYTDSVDLRGPRALINAYGIDEREKTLKRKLQPFEMNDVDQSVAHRAWQNTEEEEFDWEEDRKRGSEIYPSILPTGGNLTAVHGVNYRRDLSKAHTSILDSSIIDNISGTSFSLPSGSQKLSVLGNLLNGKLVDTFNTVPTFNPSYDPAATEIRLTDGTASTNSWHPSTLPTSHQFPPVSASPMQMQIRGQFGDQHLNEPFQLGASRSTQANSHQLPNYRSLPLHMQNSVLASQVQPISLIHQDVRPNVPLPPNASAPSHQMMPPQVYAYRGHGPTSSSIPAWPNPNAPNYSFNNIRGPVYPFPVRGPHPIINPSLNTGQSSTSQVNSNTQPGGALSGLLGSLMSHGLISLNKQDSVGVEFDADNLKVRHESVITALYANLPRQCTTCGLRFVSQDEHSKHMDWHVTKNRALNNRRTKPSPKWFVGIDMWLSGAEAVGAESAPGFLPAENTVEKKEDEEMSVPADEDQNACALCGETFEDFYSDETEEWMYKGAMYMYASGGTMVGVDRSQLGPIVHVKCRSDSHGLPSDEQDPTELGSQIKR